MIDFASGWLTELYGGEMRKAIRRTHATRWDSEPWTRGAWSAAAPGAAPARRILMEPVADAIWFAGEAVHETLWGTVAGAWESGERAADAALQRLGSNKLPAPPETEAVPKGKPARMHADRRERPERPGPEDLPYVNGTPTIMREETR
jgi:Flavin containing amine oxidoreductase